MCTRRSLHSFREGASPTQKVGAGNRAFPSLPFPKPSQGCRSKTHVAATSLELRVEFHGHCHQLSTHQLWGTTPAPLQLQPCTHKPHPWAHSQLERSLSEGKAVQEA